MAGVSRRTNSGHIHCTSLSMMGLDETVLRAVQPRDPVSHRVMPSTRGDATAPVAGVFICMHEASSCMNLRPGRALAGAAAPHGLTAGAFWLRRLPARSPSPIATCSTARFSPATTFSCAAADAVATSPRAAIPGTTGGGAAAAAAAPAFGAAAGESGPGPSAAACRSQEQNQILSPCGARVTGARKLGRLEPRTGAYLAGTPAAMSARLPRVIPAAAAEIHLGEDTHHTNVQTAGNRACGIGH